MKSKTTVKKETAKKTSTKSIAAKRTGRTAAKSKANRSLLFSAPSFSRRKLSILASVFVAFGIFAIFLTRANNVLALAEAETMTFPAGASIVTDSTASGTKALKFTFNGTASGSISLPSESSNMTLRAKGVSCNGSPQAVVEVDGIQMQTATVNSTGYTDYTVPAKLAAGTHAITITFPNDYSQHAGNSGKLKCSRDLYVDKISLLGTAPVVNSTISLSGLTEGATITGPVAVEAKATGFTLFKTEFYIDNVLYRTENSAPFCLAADNNGYPCYNWNDPARGTQATNGLHSIKAIGYDSSGLKRAEKVVNVTINNTTVTPPPPVSNTPGWNLFYQDDFDGTALNTSKLDLSNKISYWRPYNSSGHAGNGLRRPEAITLDGVGNLVITAKPVLQADGTTKTVSGGMSNANATLYGKFETRVRTEIDSSATMSGVILTWPTSAKGPEGKSLDNMLYGENDFYETLHGTTRSPFYSFIHWPNTNRTELAQTRFVHNGLTNSGPNTDATQWHRVVMEWTPELVNVKVYTDSGTLVSNETIREDSDAGTAGEREQIPDIWHRVGIQLDAFKTTPIPATVRMYVDYIRVYERQ